MNYENELFDHIFFVSVLGYCQLCIALAKLTLTIVGCDWLSLCKVDNIWELCFCEVTVVSNGQLDINFAKHKSLLCIAIAEIRLYLITVILLFQKKTNWILPTSHPARNTIVQHDTTRVHVFAGHLLFCLVHHLDRQLAGRIGVCATNPNAKHSLALGHLGGDTRSVHTDHTQRTASHINPVALQLDRSKSETKDIRSDLRVMNSDISICGFYLVFTVYINMSYTYLYKVVDRIGPYS